MSYICMLGAGICRPFVVSTLFTAILSVAPLGAQHSVARQWNEELLDAIRVDFARPTVHARNLLHTSIAMWDAWAAYDPQAAQYLHDEKASAADVAAARREAISYACYRVLKARFAASPGADQSLPSFDEKMADLGFDPAFTDTEGDTPAALGNRIAAAVLAFGATDGANEANDYANTFYSPLNPPLLPDFPGNPDIVDPNRWQPLALDFFIDQGGNPFPLGVPPFLSPEWGRVTPFSLGPEDLTIYERDSNQYWVYLDPGPPPMIGGEGDDAYHFGFEQVVEWSGQLDPADGVMIDISPNSRGNNTLGTNDGHGHDVNPFTGLPYKSQIVPAGDYYRVLAEFWADGPDSETPPGHWFTIANYVSDHPQVIKRIAGVGQFVDDLEWDVKLYLALGGTVHDAAVAAWGAKGWYDYIRPISAIRYMADRGQSSDPDGPSYHPHGIRLKPGVIEVVTSETAAPGQRHAHLAGPGNENIGKIAIYAWRGPEFIDDPETTTAGVGWILAENWWPYQRPTFVTPPFAGYVSGHSTFSRAAAELMTRFTGSAFFPGGLGEFIAPRNQFLVFEDGPSVDVTLQWATYRDASDETSISRIYGGIHPTADDIPGRLMGAKIGEQAFRFAARFFDPADTDTDGVTDSVEDSAPGDGDNNNDGVADSRQAHVASLPAGPENRYVSLVTGEANPLVGAATAEVPALPPGVVFPLGLFEFSVEAQPGGAVEVDLLLPPGVEIQTYFKYGATPADPTPHWYEFTFDGTTGAEVLGDRVRLHFVDGSRGDDDLTANGLITEPGGPANVLGNVFYFPQIVDGTFATLQFQTAVSLANTGEEDATALIEFFSAPDGVPMAVQLGDLGTGARFEVELAAGESLSLESPGTSDLQVGYGRISTEDGVGGVLVFGRTDLTTGVRLFETGVAASGPVTEFTVLVDSIGHRDTGVALVYPDGIEPRPDASVTVRLYDEDSSLVAERTLPPLAAGAHLARFVRELFDDEAVQSFAGEMRGTLKVTSDQPLAAVTFRQTEPPAGYPDSVPFLTTFPVIW